MIKKLSTLCMEGMVDGFREYLNRLNPENQIRVKNMLSEYIRYDDRTQLGKENIRIKNFNESISTYLGYVGREEKVHRSITSIYIDGVNVKTSIILNPFLGNICIEMDVKRGFLNPFEEIRPSKRRLFWNRNIKLDHEIFSIHLNYVSDFYRTIIDTSTIFHHPFGWESKIYDT